MKTSLHVVTLAVAFSITASASGQEMVGSLNVRGVQAVDLPAAGDFAMMSLPFEIEDNSLQAVFGDALQGSASVAAADKLRFWDNNRYASVALGPDGVFYRLNDQGHWKTPLEPVNFSIPIGEGFWVTSGAQAERGRQVTLDGDVVLDATAGVSFHPGFQMVSYPFSSEIDLQDTTLGESGTAAASAGSADYIRVWNTTTRRYEGYGLGMDKNWYRLDVAGRWVDPLEPAQHVLKPGQAFFYFARQPFTWLEQNPYADSAFAE
jgi:hypothetical protein